MADRPFVCFKFVTDDSEEVIYDVCLESWITEGPDAAMRAKIRWPKNSAHAGPLVRMEKPPKSDFEVEDVIIKRFYATYDEALNGCNRRLDDTNYETDHEQNSQRRRKRPSWWNEDNYEMSTSSHRSHHADNDADYADSERESGEEHPTDLVKGKKKKKNEMKLSKPKNTLKPPPPPPPLIITNSRLANLSAKASCSTAQDTPNKFQVNILKNKSRIDKSCKNNSKKNIKSPSELEKPSPDSNHDEIMDLSDAEALSYSEQVINNSSPLHLDSTLSDGAADPGSTVKTDVTPAKDITNQNTLPPSNEIQQGAVSEAPSGEINLSQLLKDIEEMKGLQEKTVKILGKVNQKVDNLSVNVGRIVRSVIKGEKFIKLPPGLSDKIPADSLYKLQQLESALANQDTLSALMQYLTKYITSDSEQSTRDIMVQVIGQTVCKAYNMAGTHGKLKFSKTKTWDAISGALLTEFQGESMKAAEKAAGRWMSNTAYERTPAKASS